jgi:cysteate synthase
MNNFTPTSYILQSVYTGKKFADEGWMLEAPDEAEPSLIRAVYENARLQVKDASRGLFQFADWLPVKRYLTGSSAPVTYQSDGLARHLGLGNLYITFSGFWPEKGAGMQTCSFKETEAYSVCGRLEPGVKDVLVVASAGNTARAFARVCSDNDIPLVLCVPEDNLNALWFDEPIRSNVRLFCTRSGSDYFDAIHLSNLICALPGFFPEGGAKNIARRDGMGTTVLSAADYIKRIPDYYFQAIGSGTGAIAAWEANQRLIADGGFGSHKMKLMVSQNEPFLPMYHAWRQDSRQMLPYDDNEARLHAEEITAKVLSNRKPPYPIHGGLFDALKDTGGDILKASNAEAAEAAALFEKTEGIDIHPAAAVATATLINSVQNGKIPKDACIMLNITGGGENRFKQDKEVSYLKPCHVFNISPDMKRVAEAVCI